MQHPYAIKIIHGQQSERFIIIYIHERLKGYDEVFTGFERSCIIRKGPLVWVSEKWGCSLKSGRLWYINMFNHSDMFADYRKQECKYTWRISACSHFRCQFFYRKQVILIFYKHLLQISRTRKLFVQMWQLKHN